MISRIIKIEILEEIKKNNEILYKIIVTMSDNTSHIPYNLVNYDTLYRTIEKENPEIVDSRTFSMSLLSKMLSFINPMSKLPSFNNNTMHIV